VKKSNFVEKTCSAGLPGSKKFAAAKKVETNLEKNTRRGSKDQNR